MGGDCLISFVLISSNITMCKLGNVNQYLMQFDVPSRHISCPPGCTVNYGTIVKKGYFVGGYTVQLI